VPARRLARELYGKVCGSSSRPTPASGSLRWAVAEISRDDPGSADAGTAVASG